MPQRVLWRPLRPFQDWTLRVNIFLSRRFSAAAFHIKIDLKMKHWLWKPIRSIFRTFSNIQDVGFWKNGKRLFVFTIFAKSSILDVWQDSDSPLKPVMTCGKSSISDVWQILNSCCINYFCKTIFPLSLLNLINIFHHISSNTVLCTVKSACSCIFWKCIRYTIHWDKTRMLKNFIQTK